MKFEWDQLKNEANIGKHGVSFEQASRIFDGPIFSRADDRHNYGEERTLSIGGVEGVLFLAVVHTDRQGRARIISARRANRTERKAYEEAIAKAIQHR